MDSSRNLGGRTRFVEGDILDRINVVEHIRKTAGKSNEYSLKRLQNIQLRVDKANFLRFALIKKAVSGRLADAAGEDGRKVAHIIRMVSGLAKPDHAYASHTYMRWSNIGRCADALGVPMELLIDEDYYYDGFGWAGYRVLCEVYRQRADLAELTRLDSVSDHPLRCRSWYQAWYAFILGRKIFGINIRPYYFGKIIQLCNERLGMPISYLISRKLHSTNAVDIYCEIRNVFSSLGDREVAFVAAVAKALQNKNSSSGLVDDVNKLLRWYLNGEEAQSGERVGDRLRACAGDGT